MEVLRTLLRSTLYAAAGTAIVLVGIAAALWCAQALRSVPDQAAPPFRPPSVATAAPGAGSDSTLTPRQGDAGAPMDPEQVSAHITGIERAEDLTVISTDLPATAAGQEVAEQIALHYAQEHTDGCDDDPEPPGQVSVRSRDDVHLAGLPRTFTVVEACLELNE